MKKVALYAGAFNPPTLAHKKIITGIIDTGLVDELIFAPTGPRTDKSYGIEHHFREQILSIFYEEIKNEGYQIHFSDYFLKNKNNGNTTTIGMDSYFRSLEPNREIHHIFGIDVIPQIPHWEGNENKLVETTLKKIFIERKGYPIPKPFNMQHSTFVDFDIEGISSTLAREMIRTQKNIDSILTPGVTKFIQTNNLYL